MNPYIIWLFRISLAVAPVALLLSWHYELRVAELIEHSIAIDIDYPAESDFRGYRETLRGTLEFASSAGRFWGELFHLMAGALIGMGAYTVVHRRGELAAAVGLDGGVERLRYRRRRSRLLMARYPGPYADAYGWYSILLIPAAGVIAWIANDIDTSFGLDGLQSIISAAAVVVCAASTLCIFRAIRLSARVITSFGSLFRFIALFFLVAINGLSWLLVLVANE